MRAIILENDGGSFSCDLKRIEPEIGRKGLKINLEYSSLNYKDALAITNNAPVVRRWPMVAGIDGAGTVAEDDSGTIKPGTKVAVTGWGMGETSWGCLADEVVVEPGWPTVLPAALTARDAMCVGTAGFTAMLCVMALERGGMRPEDGPVLVTGASGGVGSMALMFLKHLGFHAVASSGRTADESYFRALGAQEVIDRAEFATPSKPLQKERWAAAIDCVGSHTLANVCAQTRYGGVVAACGLAQGMDFPATVAPFILRGVTLAGVDSVMAPSEIRSAAWARIATSLDRTLLDAMIHEVGLSGAIEAAHDLMAGKVRGRVLVRIDG